MNQITRIPREGTSLRQRTTQAVRAAILEGVFTPGQKLSERELCEQLDVSRSCLRESLQHLQAEGLITIIPHRGPEVTAITPKEVRDIYAVRSSLESLVVRGFVHHATAGQRQALHAKLDELSDAQAGNEQPRILLIKNQFYDILLEGCGNDVAGQLLRQLNNRVTVLRRMSLSQPERLPQTILELQVLLAAIDAGDEHEAARLCAIHVANAADNVLRHVTAPS